MHDAADGPGRVEVELIASRRVHEGFRKLDVLQVRTRREGAGWTPAFEREVVEVRDGVTVLPWAVAADRVMLVRQFRAGLWRGTGATSLVEAPAGVIDPGETVEEAVRRECLEETGVTLGRLARVGAVAVNPAVLTQIETLFVGEWMGDAAPTALDGDEDLVPFSCARAALGEVVAGPGGVQDGRLAMLALWLEGRHEALRRIWGY